MYDIYDTNSERDYWSNRYEEQRLGWDIGHPSTPLVEYIEQLDRKDLRILIPGAGNAYEAEYFYKNGYTNVHVLDISPHPLEQFQLRNPEFPPEQLIQANFFEHQGQYDLILEQTFFCSFYPSPENRTEYAKHCASLLSDSGKLAGLWFNFPKGEVWEKRPFGGSKEEYLGYLEHYFEVKSFELCYNSIPPRMGNELFGIFVKKSM